MTSRDCHNLLPLPLLSLQPSVQPVVMLLFLKISWHFLVFLPLFTLFFFFSWPFLPRWNSTQQLKCHPLCDVFPSSSGPWWMLISIFSSFYGLSPHSFIIDLTTTLILSPFHRLWISIFLPSGLSQFPIQINYLINACGKI